MKMIRLGVLVSGRGSNLKAIHAAMAQGQLHQVEIAQVEIAIVISNRPQAEALTFCREQGLPAVILAMAEYSDRLAFDEAMAAVLKEHQVDVVVLAGYDRIIGDPLLTAFPERILNIHPSLLPAYGGKGMLGIKVHEAVLKNHETESGCSVHLVTPVVDGGAVLGQRRVPVHASDTPATLAERVLKEEHQLYPEIIAQFTKRLSSLGGVLLLFLMFFQTGCNQGDFVNQRAVATLNEKAQALIQSGDNEGAIARLESAHDLIPDEPNTLYNLAVAYETKGQQLEGEAQDAAKSDPKKQQTFFQQAQQIESMALDDYRKAVPGLKDATDAKKEISRLEAHLQGGLKPQKNTPPQKSHAGKA